MKQLSFDYGGREVVVLQNGEPWFVASHVCGVLGLANSRKAVARLDDDERRVSPVVTPGGTQPTTLVSESGLYSLILTSRKPEAKKFKKWVTSEVLPAIRKTGHYDAPEPERRSLPAPAKPRASSFSEVWDEYGDAFGSGFRTKYYTLLEEHCDLLRRQIDQARRAPVVTQYRAARAWTTDEDARALSMFGDGITARTIGDALGRGVYGVRYRLRVLRRRGTNS